MPPWVFVLAIAPVMAVAGVVVVGVTGIAGA